MLVNLPLFLPSTIKDLGQHEKHSTFFKIPCLGAPCRQVQQRMCIQYRGFMHRVSGFLFAGCDIRLGYAVSFIDTYGVDGCPCIPNSYLPPVPVMMSREHTLQTRSDIGGCTRLGKFGRSSISIYSGPRSFSGCPGT